MTRSKRLQKALLVSFDLAILINAIASGYILLWSHLFATNLPVVGHWQAHGKGHAYRLLRREFSFLLCGLNSIEVF